VCSSDLQAVDDAADDADDADDAAGGGYGLDKGY
jgi:hypothetical protein